MDARGSSVPPEVISKRQETVAVNAYLEALALNQPGPGGTHWDADTYREKLAEMPERISAASTMVERLRLMELRRKWQAQLDALEGDNALPVLEARFVQVAKSFSDRTDISYQTWREAGVPAAVLKSAGL